MQTVLFVCAVPQKKDIITQDEIYVLKLLKVLKLEFVNFVINFLSDYTFLLKSITKVFT
jgi:hypothetical protein